MPLFEYVLVALMGAAGHSVATPLTTLGPEAIAQPNGGALSAAQEPPKKGGSHRHTTQKRRHHRRRHTPDMPKKDGGK